jgi:hypothetical protein
MSNEDLAREAIRCVSLRSPKKQRLLRDSECIRQCTEIVGALVQGNFHTLADAEGNLQGSLIELEQILSPLLGKYGLSSQVICGEIFQWMYRFVSTDTGSKDEWIKRSKKFKRMSGVTTGKVHSQGMLGLHIKNQSPRGNEIHYE